MAFNLADRVRETTTSTGTGAIALGGAVVGFRTFAAGINVGDTTWYAIVGGLEYETGLGTLTSTGVLTRNTVYESSNANALVAFSAGSKEVFITAPAQALEILATLVKATGADLRGLTDATKFLTAKAEADAITILALGNITGTVALNFANGMNQSGTATGNLTLGQHNGIFDGEPVTMEIVQDGAGFRTLAANTTYNKFSGGTVPTLTSAAGSRDILYGTARVIGSVSLVHWTGFAKDIK